MPPSRITYNTVLKIGRTLPDVEEAVSWGQPALKCRGKLLACQAIHKSAEPDTVVVKIPKDQRDAMITDDPATYYLTDHYAPYASVLVRLGSIREDQLTDLLRAASRAASTDGKKKTQRRSANG